MERVYIDKQLDGASEVVSEIEKTLPDVFWIPVESQIPENDSVCLVVGRRGAIRVARAYVPAATGNWRGDPNEVWFTVVGTGHFFQATHWAPIPKPPANKKR